MQLRYNEKEQVATLCLQGAINYRNRKKQATKVQKMAEHLNAVGYEFINYRTTYPYHYYYEPITREEYNEVRAEFESYREVLNGG